MGPARTNVDPVDNQNEAFNDQYTAGTSSTNIGAVITKMGSVGINMGLEGLIWGLQTTNGGPVWINIEPADDYNGTGTGRDQLRTCTRLTLGLEDPDCSFCDGIMPSLTAKEAKWITRLPTEQEFVGLIPIQSTLKCKVSTQCHSAGRAASNSWTVEV